MSRKLPEAKRALWRNVVQTKAFKLDYLRQVTMIH